MCGRCRCCSLREIRQYRDRNPDSPYCIDWGACVGSCHENGHTTESVDAALQAEYERQWPIRRAIERERDDAIFDAAAQFRELDRLYERAGWPPE